MAFKGPIVNQGDGNLGNEPANKDRVIAFVFGGVGTAEMPLNTPKRIVAPAQAVALGIDAAYDANNGFLAHDDIAEAFRLSEATEMIIMVTDRPDGTAGNGLVNWFDADGPIEAMLRTELAKYVKYVFTKFNPDGMVPTFTNDGFAQEMLDCIPAAQALRERFYSEGRMLHGTMLDGWKFDQVASLQNLRELEAPNVSVIGAVDGYVLDNYPAYPSLAAVGAVMGMLAVRQLNEDLGGVELVNFPASKAGDESYPLEDGTRWPYAALLNGENINTHTMAVQEDMAEKGLIFAGSFNEFDGFFFSGDPTCEDLESDYAWINNNCIFSEAARLVRLGMIPKMRSVLKKDPATGFLRGTTAKSVELSGQKKLNLLLTRNLVSEARVFLNAEQTPSQQTPLVADVEIVKDGILYKLTINLGLYNSLSA